MHQIGAYNKILSFLDIIEVKEYSEEYDGFLGKELKMVDDEIARLEKLKVKEVDLEKELKYYCNDYYNCDYPKQIEEETCSEVMPHIVSAAKHFFKLGMAVSNKAQKGE